MRHRIAALALLALACVSAWACFGVEPVYANCTPPCTKAQITTDINANWPDNTAGAITPAILRATVLLLVNSYLDINGASSASCGTHQFLTAIATLSTYTCGQPAIADISGFGTGVATALGVNVGSAGAPVLFNGAGGTPSALVLTNATGLPIGGGGTGQTTAAGARSSSGLNIDGQTGHGDSIFSIAATDRVVVTNAAFTASRAWTLPTAASTNAGQPLTVCDQAMTLTGTNSLVVTANGADTIVGHNGAVSTITMTNPGACVTLLSDGVSKWNNPASMLAPSIQIKTSGSGNITTPNGVLYCVAKLQGGGGGGAGSGTTPGAATAGGNTTLDTLTANGGALGSTSAGGTAAGGTAIGCNIITQTGGAGGGASNQNATSGGTGGGSRYGAGSQGGFATAAPAASTAPGSGGGGAGQNTTANGGGGGGAGGYCEHVYTNPIPTTLAYAVGAKGNAGTAGTGGNAGADGVAGRIEYACYFQ